MVTGLEVHGNGSGMYPSGIAETLNQAGAVNHQHPQRCLQGCLARALNLRVLYLKVHALCNPIINWETRAVAAGPRDSRLVPQRVPQNVRSLTVYKWKGNVISQEVHFRAMGLAHWVEGQLDVEDEEGGKALLQRQVGLVPYHWRSRQLHMLRDVVELEIEGVDICRQQAVRKTRKTGLMPGFYMLRLGHVVQRDNRRVDACQRWPTP